MRIQDDMDTEFLGAEAAPDSILLVESNHEVHPGLITCLAEVGSDIVHALTPEDATDFLKRGLRPSVVVTAVTTTSDIDGLEFADLIHWLRPETPVVFSTSGLDFLRRRSLRPRERFASRAALSHVVQREAAQHKARHLSMDVREEELGFPQILLPDAAARYAGAGRDGKQFSGPGKRRLRTSAA